MGIVTNEPNKSIIREARGSLEAVIKQLCSSAARARRETWSGIASFPVPAGLGNGMFRTELCELFYFCINKISPR